MTAAEYTDFIQPLKDIRALHVPFMDALRARQETSALGGAQVYHLHIDDVYIFFVSNLFLSF